MEYAYIISIKSVRHLTLKMHHDIVSQILFYMILPSTNSYRTRHASISEALQCRTQSTIPPYTTSPHVPAYGLASPCFPR